MVQYPYTEVLEKEGKDGHPALVVQKAAASIGGDKNLPFKEYAMIARDRVNAKGETEKTDLEIQSETMQAALHSIFGEHSSVGVRADPIVFRKPYYSLFHCRHEIREMAEDKSSSEEKKRHLKWLVDFMSENFKTLDTIQEGLVDKGLISFEHLPIIFEVGSIVVGQTQGDVEKPTKREARKDRATRMLPLPRNRR